VVSLRGRSGQGGHGGDHGSNHGPKRTGAHLPSLFLR
jgi:hypothetical protein